MADAVFRSIENAPPTIDANSVAAGALAWQKRMAPTAPPTSSNATSDNRHRMSGLRGYGLRDIPNNAARPAGNSAAPRAGNLNDACGSDRPAFGRCAST